MNFNYFKIMISSWIKTIGFVIKSMINRMNKKESKTLLICFFCQSFQVIPIYIIILQIYMFQQSRFVVHIITFLIVLNFLDSHHTYVLYILYKMPYQFYLCKCHHNVNMKFYKLLLAVALVQLDLLGLVKFA